MIWSIRLNLIMLKSRLKKIETAMFWIKIIDFNWYNKHK